VCVCPPLFTRTPSLTVYHRSNRTLPYPGAFQYIEWLDRRGIALIEAHDRPGFVAYLKGTCLTRARCQIRTPPVLVLTLPLTTIRTLPSVLPPHPPTETKNTICGREPILLLLAVLQRCQHQQEENSSGGGGGGGSAGNKGSATLTQYAQSGQVTDVSGSSVSYASIVFTA